MTVNYSVTFEFDLKPPLTHRGQVSASNVQTCCQKAVRESHKALTPARWSSVVCVLLERVQEQTVKELT